MDIVRRNPSAPHTIIIGIKAEIHEKLPTGEVSGDPVLQQERVVQIGVSDRSSAVSVLDDILRSLNERQN